MNGNEHCQRDRVPALAAGPRAAVANCVNGNETEQAADAHVPLQSKSHQQIPPTETWKDVLAPWRW